MQTHKGWFILQGQWWYPWNLLVVSLEQQLVLNSLLSEVFVCCWALMTYWCKQQRKIVAAVAFVWSTCCVSRQKNWSAMLVRISSLLDAQLPVLFSSSSECCTLFSDLYAVPIHEVNRHDLTWCCCFSGPFFGASSGVEPEQEGGGVTQCGQSPQKR